MWQVEVPAFGGEIKFTIIPVTHMAMLSDARPFIRMPQFCRFSILVCISKNLTKVYLKPGVLTCHQNTSDLW